METVLCIASGPSLTLADCERALSSGLQAITVNSSWKMAPWAAICYAGDYGWWAAHADEVPHTMDRWTCSKSAAEQFRLHYHPAGNGAYNSGQRAIELAIKQGARRVLLLGYDCDVSAGTHWHGDHARLKNPDATRARQWRQQFDAMDLQGAQVINCSRQTALTRFPRLDLESALVL